jgi:hypothetical protein
MPFELHGDVRSQREAEDQDAHGRFDVVGRRVGSAVKRWL